MDVYEKEGLFVPSEDKKAEVSTLQTKKLVIDNPIHFSSVSHILEAILRENDPANRILVKYLASINTTVMVGVLFPKGVKGSSKAIRAPKEKKKTEQPKPIQENVEEEVSKEVIPSKPGILHRTKKLAHRPHHSPEMTSVQVDNISSPKHVCTMMGVKMIQKPQLNRRGVLIREINVPVSPASKKRQAREMVKKIMKKK